MRILLCLLVLLLAVVPVAAQDDAEEIPPSLLTDPFLQLPGEDSVYVVWFTLFAGTEHTVTYGEDETVSAETMEMSRLFEDGGSRLGDAETNTRLYSEVTERPIYRHEALVTGLTPGERVPYFVTSIAEDGTEVTSDSFTLAPLPAPGQPMRILLTSDHQLMPMTPANLQKVEETVGQVDAVFLAGDLENIPDRGAEWFDDWRGRAFFPGLQGRANATLEYTVENDGVEADSSTTYTGGELIQHAPLFPAAGNHEVMGRFDPTKNLNQQYGTPHPREVAEARYELYAEIVNPEDDPAIREEWIQNNSWNTITYEELFTLPSGPEGERYYALQFGDVYLISLFVTRFASPGDLIYGERPENLPNPENWTYGQVMFGTVQEGNTQYEWLQEQLNSEAFQNARYKVVMLHHPVHTLGGRIVPAFTEPVQVVEYAEDGSIEAIRYEYPKAESHIINDLQPLLEEAGVNLVLTGHTHVWNRFVGETGINFLESANVGNSYDASFQGESNRRLPPDERWTEEYDPLGDPYGLEPVMPSEAAVQFDEDGNPLPFVASDEITAFSIFETETGTVSSYYFDTRDPESDVILFDQFTLE